jgi:hypothetical protein
VFQIHRKAIACGIVLTLAVPGTALAQQDLRSPDTRDAATAPAPDVTSPQIFTDQQRAIVERYKVSPSYQAALSDARAPQPAQVHADSGLDWRDAGIGAVGMLGLTLAALGGVVAVNHRRHPAATAR